MRYVEIEGMRLSRIGLGTWQFGSREWGYGDGYATDVAPALIQRAVELGITMLDTAEAYGPATLRADHRGDAGAAARRRSAPG